MVWSEEPVIEAQPVASTALAMIATRVITFV
jgi:hypothetical protein